MKEASKVKPHARLSIIYHWNLLFPGRLARTPQRPVLGDPTFRSGLRWAPLFSVYFRVFAFYCYNMLSYMGLVSTFFGMIFATFSIGDTHFEH
jgi:hypothetical protein